MSAAVAAVATAAAASDRAEVRNLVHYSSREIVSWGRIPKKSEYNFSSLASSQHRTAVQTGKPKGLWYAYEAQWLTHYKPSVNVRTNLSKTNKANSFQYKYVFPVPESTFTTDLKEDPTKILVLSLANFREFLAHYGAPGIGASRIDGVKLGWYEFWSGIPREYTRVPYDGIQGKFAGVEFSQDLVEYSADVFTVVAPPHGQKKITISVDLPSGAAAMIDVSFLQYLEVPSGCIFSPEKLFTRPPVDYLVERPIAAAGGRRTRKARRRTLWRHRAPRPL